MVRTTQPADSEHCACGRLNHRWDSSTTNWGKDGKRTHPCMNCPADLVIGSVRIGT